MLAMETFKDLPVMAFETADAWRAWLDAHHLGSQGLWLRIYKKDSGVATVTYAQALDEALCYGWIDSSKHGYDDASFLQRFSPRKARSIWSTINREHVARLTEAGKLMPAGLAAVETAKANGQWEAAYEGSAKMQVPPDLQAALDASPKARAFFEQLDRTNRYAFCFRVQQPKKPETRAKKVAWAIELLENGQKVH